VPCYLIGQLAKNDQYAGCTNGNEIVAHAIHVCGAGHELIGGRFVRVDCRDSRRLVEFYRRNDFTPLQKDEASGLLQMVRYLP